MVENSVNDYRKKETNEKKKIKNSFIKKHKKLIGVIGGIALGATIVVGPEYKEHEVKKQIEENANIEVMRSFKNIKKENRGKYLDNEIKKLYEKYPNLDDIILESGKETEDLDFIDDIYRLYKAFMVDKSNEKIENIEDIKVTQVDQIIMLSDRITEGDKKIKETRKEQYKKITDDYIEAKEGKKGTKLAKEMYELLTIELGLEEDILTSPEIQEEIDKRGIYYDMKNNTVYTKEGRGYIVLDKERAKEEVETNKKDGGYERED